MTQRLEGVAREIYDSLLVADEDQIRNGIKARFDGDAATTWRGLQGRATVMINPQDDFMRSALRLRILRLSREREAITAMIAEAEAGGDHGAARDLNRQLLLYTRAQDRLDAELGRRLR
jgi:hypothetical protein